MLRPAEIFQNYMVLQRGKSVRLFGESDRECTVKVFLNGRQIAAAAVSKGIFDLQLPPQNAMEDVELVLVTDIESEEIRFAHVDFGEVWIAGGQSNMEFLLKYDCEAENMIPSAGDPHFRFYDVGEYAWEGERALGLKDASSWDHWMSFEPGTAGKFSAVCVFFAGILRSRLKLPVGIVGCNWGGTSASTWVPYESLKNDPVLCRYTGRFERDIQGVDMDKYMAGLKKPNPYASNPRVIAETEKRMKNEILKKPGLLTRIVGKIIVASSKVMPCSEYRPGGLYTTMVNKIAGFTSAGFLWYQGESDQKDWDCYDRLMKLLIGTWRADWKEALPFLMVQLTSYEGWPECSGDDYEKIREKQQYVADSTEKVYLASVMDAGSRYDIHPKNKRPVGERLAALALHYVYNMQVSCEAPRLRSVKRTDEGLDAVFDQAEKGLTARGNISSLFNVQADGREIPIEAEIRKNIVSLKGSFPAEGRLTVSFAYRKYCPMTLFNSEGLAARPSGPIEVMTVRNKH